jgi:hypothetical protein
VRSESGDPASELPELFGIRGGDERGDLELGTYPAESEASAHTGPPMEWVYRSFLKLEPGFNVKASS